MFALTANETGAESDEALNDFLDIEQHLFEQLGLHFRFTAVFVLNCLPVPELFCVSDKATSSAYVLDVNVYFYTKPPICTSLTLIDFRTQR